MRICSVQLMHTVLNSNIDAPIGKPMEMERFKPGSALGKDNYLPRSQLVLVFFDKNNSITDSLV